MLATQHLRPALTSRRHALGFLAGLIVCLGLPLVVGAFAPASKYRGLTGAQAHGAFLARALEQGGATDVLVLGSSRSWSGVDTDYLAARLGPGRRVLNFATNGGQLDLYDVLLADVLRRGTVKLLLVEANLASENDRARPHVWASWWWDGGERVAGLPWRARLELYGYAMLGAPRRLLERIRRGGEDFRFASPPPSYLSRTTNFSSRGGPPAPEIPMPELAPSVTIVDPRDDPRVRRDDDVLTAYERIFLARLLARAEAHGVRVAFVVLPVRHDTAPSTARPGTIVVPGWLVELPRNVTVVAVEAAAWPASVSANAFSDDEHLNGTGARRYTAAIAPALEELLR